MPRLVNARRSLMLVAIVAAGSVAGGLVAGRDEAPASSVRGDVAACVKLTSDAARSCYRREVGRQLARLAGRNPDVLSASVSFAVTVEDSELLCDLHERLGDGAAAAPGWVRWPGPSASAARL